MTTDGTGAAETPSAHARPREGKADLHVHTLASDGVSGVEEILAFVESSDLDVVAITDHERIDAGIAARRIALARGLRTEIIVGEEITTRNGHLIALFLERKVAPWRSMRESVLRVHEQGGIAIVAHPLVPYPLCASAGTIRRLLDDPDPAAHPDAIEAFNPTTARMRWSRQVPGFVAEVGLAAVAASDAHRADLIGRARTRFPGRSAEDLRAAILARETDWEGRGYAWAEQMGMFRRQMTKNVRALGEEIGGKVIRRDGTGRDLGYPGGRLRPVRFDPRAAGIEDEPAAGPR